MSSPLCLPRFGRVRSANRDRNQVTGNPTYQEFDHDCAIKNSDRSQSDCRYASLFGCRVVDYQVCAQRLRPPRFHATTLVYIFAAKRLGQTNTSRIFGLLDVWRNFDNPEWSGAVPEQISRGLTHGGFRKDHRCRHSATRTPPKRHAPLDNICQWTQ